MPLERRGWADRFRRWKRKRRKESPKEIIALGVGILALGIMVFLAGVFLDLVRYIGPYCGGVDGTAFTCAQGHGNGYPGVGLTFAFFGGLYIAMGLEERHKQKIRLTLQTERVTNSRAPLRPRIWLRMGVIGAAFLAFALFDAFAFGLVFWGVALFGVVWLIPFFAHELHRIGTIGMAILGTLLLTTAASGILESNPFAWLFATLGVLLFVPLGIREFRWVQSEVEPPPSSVTIKNSRRLAYCTRCGKGVDKHEITKFDSSLRGMRKEGSVMRICRDCLTEEFSKSLSANDARGVVVYPMKDREPLHVNAYQFYSLDEMADLGWPEEFVNGLKDLLPGSVVCQSCGKAKARYNWCSPDVYFNDYTSQELNSRERFEMMYLCASCLAGRLMRKIADNDSHLDEFLPPVGKDAFGTSFEV